MGFKHRFPGQAADQGLSEIVCKAALRRREIRNDAWVMKIVTTNALEAGMILGDDIHTRDGNPLLAKGLEVTPAMLEHLKLMSQSVGIIEPSRIMIRSQESTTPI